MANFFEGVGNLLKHPIDEAKWMLDETKGVLKPALKGDFGESWDSFKGSFGRHNKMMEDITVPLGGRNKLTENPDAVAGAVIGSIFAAPAASSMFGGGGTPSGGFGGFGQEGAFSKYFQPGSSISKPGLDTSGVGWKPGQFGNDLGSPSFTSNSEFADMAEAGVTDVGGKKFDLQAFGQMLQHVKPQQHQNLSGGGRVGGGFRAPDQSLYQNPLLTREFNQLYGQPLYTPPTGGQR